MHTNWKGTPGIFTVQHFNDEPTPCICAGEGGTRLATMEMDAQPEDAALFAAAPELLAGLQAIALWAEGMGPAGVNGPVTMSAYAKAVLYNLYKRVA